MLENCHPDSIGILVAPFKSNYTRVILNEAKKSKYNVILTDKPSIYLDLNLFIDNKQIKKQIESSYINVYKFNIYNFFYFLILFLLLLYIIFFK